MKITLPDIKHNLPADIRGKKVLWGVAPTGAPHLGYLTFILLLQYFQKHGAECTVLIADYHSYLDAEKAAWEERETKAQLYENCFKQAGLQTIRASSFYTSQSYHELLLKYSTKLNLDDILKSGYSTLSTSHIKPTLGDALCTTSQIIDPLYLGSDIVICGNDEAPIYEYGLSVLAKTMQTTFAYLYASMCPGLIEKEMHASAPGENNILLSDNLEIITEKVTAYLAKVKNKSNENSALAIYCQHVLFPLTRLLQERETIPQSVITDEFAYLATGIAESIAIAFSHTMKLEKTPSPLASDVSLVERIESKHSQLPTLSRTSSIKQPIFIVGCPRSGTTVISSCIQAHSKLQGGDESLFLLDLWRIYADLHQGKNNRGWAPLNDYINEDELLKQMGNLADAVFQRFQETGNHYVDHTPWYAAIIPFINCLYPDSIFIHVVRNGIDVVNSLGVSYEKGFTWAGKDISERAQLWKQLAESGLRYKTIVGDARYLQVDYESFCANPVDTLKQVFAKLKLDWEDNCLLPLTVPHAGPGRGEGAVLGCYDENNKLVISTNVRAYDLTKWSPKDVADFKKEAQSLMAELGYQAQLEKLENLTIPRIQNNHSPVMWKMPVADHSPIEQHTPALNRFTP